MSLLKIGIASVDLKRPTSYSTLGAVHKLRLRRGVGGQKNQLFVNIYPIENVNRGDRWSKKDQFCKHSL